MNKTITIAHGNGGQENNELISKIFYKHFEKGILKDVKADQFVFAALGKSSMLLFGNGRAMVLGRDKVGVLSPGKPLSFYKNGEEFLLRP